MSEPITMICLPTASHSPRVPGCTREYCAVCGEEVWVSPASFALGVARYLCIECAPGVMEAEGGAITGPFPGQVAEVEKYWGPL